MEGIDRFGLDKYLAGKREEERKAIMQELLDSKYIAEAFADPRGIAVLRYLRDGYANNRMEVLRISGDPTIDKDTRQIQIEECGTLARIIRGHLENLAAIWAQGEAHAQKINSL